MRIRKIEDAEKLLHLVKRVESQSDFMMMGAGERKTTSEQQRRHVENVMEQKNSTIFVAEEKDAFIGYLFAIGGSAERTKHAVYLVLGILQEYRGQGIGTKMLASATDWAREQQFCD